MTRVEIASLLWRVSVRYYARTGTWPESLTLVLRGGTPPKALADEARMARAIYLSNPEADYG